MAQDEQAQCTFSPRTKESRNRNGRNRGECNAAIPCNPIVGALDCSANVKRQTLLLVAAPLTPAQREESAQRLTSAGADRLSVAAAKKQAAALQQEQSLPTRFQSPPTRFQSPKRKATSPVRIAALSEPLVRWSPPKGPRLERNGGPSRRSVSKSDEFCIENEEFCIESDEICRARRGRFPTAGENAVMIPTRS